MRVIRHLRDTSSRKNMSDKFIGELMNKYSTKKIYDVNDYLCSVQSIEILFGSITHSQRYEDKTYYTKIVLENRSVTCILKI